MKKNIPVLINKLVDDNSYNEFLEMAKGKCFFPQHKKKIWGFNIQFLIQNMFCFRWIVTIWTTTKAKRNWKWDSQHQFDKVDVVSKK
jgi:hypothetical protein